MLKYDRKFSYIVSLMKIKTIILQLITIITQRNSMRGASTAPVRISREKKRNGYVVLLNDNLLSMYVPISFSSDIMYISAMSHDVDEKISIPASKYDNTNAYITNMSQPTTAPGFEYNV